ncbi:hypothetical protein ACLKA7_015237 [Drosophila subpalustris]
MVMLALVLVVPTECGSATGKGESVGRERKAEKQLQQHQQQHHQQQQQQQQHHATERSNDCRRPLSFNLPGYRPPPWSPSTNGSSFWLQCLMVFTAR